jgi:hypothetical protein
MAKAGGDLTSQLRAMCSVSPAKCQAALKASKGDVDKALRALIASGDVALDDLDPELATKEHYALFSLRRQLSYAEAAAAVVDRLGADTARRVRSELKDVRDKLAGKKRPDPTALEQGAQARRQAIEARKARRPDKPNPDPGTPEDPVVRLQRVSSITAPRCQAALRAA